METPAYWAFQSPATDHGEAASAVDALDSSLSALRYATSQLVFHSHSGDFANAGVPTARKAEINTRFAAPMLARILASDGTVGGPPLLARPRPGAERTVSCYRDAVVLSLALARRKGVAARARIGFTSYLLPDSWTTHPDGSLSPGSLLRKPGLDYLNLRRGADFLVSGPCGWPRAVVR